MEKEENKGEHFQDKSGLTLAIAGALIACVVYFFLEHYNLASEYYASQPPYVLIGLVALAASAGVYFLLKAQEPDREDSYLYAVLLSVGVCLFLYSFIPRLNIITDSQGLGTYPYTLNEDYVWEPDEGLLPDLDLYMHNSEFWQQFEPGDGYSFELREGGLGTWLVNMEQVYEDQRTFYECGGYLDCAHKGWGKSAEKLKENFTGSRGSPYTPLEN